MGGGAFDLVDRDVAPEETPKPPKETGPERWARWQKALASGEVESKAALAAAEGLSRAAVTMGLRKLAMALQSRTARQRAVRAAPVQAPPQALCDEEPAHHGAASPRSGTPLFPDTRA